METESNDFPVSKYYGYDTSVPLRGAVYIANDTTDFTTLAINHNSVLNDEQIAIMKPKDQKILFYTMPNTGM